MYKYNTFCNSTLLGFHAIIIIIVLIMILFSCAPASNVFTHNMNNHKISSLEFSNFMMLLLDHVNDKTIRKNSGFTCSKLFS